MASMAPHEPNRAERAVLTALSAITNPTWLLFLIVSAGQVVARYVLNIPFLWAEELARFTLIWFCFLGAIQLVILDDHIEIDFVVRRVGGAWQRLFWLLRQAAILATGLMLVLGTLNLMALSAARSPATGLPVSLWYAAGAVAGLGFIIVSSLRLLAWAASRLKTTRIG